jgi:hypothetical protein
MNRINELIEKANELQAEVLTFRTENEAINHVIDKSYKYIDPIAFENAIINKKCYYSKSHNTIFLVDVFGLLD